MVKSTGLLLFQSNALGFYSLLFCSLFIIENAFSRKHWERDLVQVGYLKKENAIVIKFKFFDYDFGPVSENGYMEYADFEFSDQNIQYKHLMKFATKDQKKTGWTYLNITNKYHNAQIQLFGCHLPENKSMWNKDMRIRVYDKGNEAYLTVKWFLNEELKDVQYLRLNGLWHVNGVYKREYLENVVYKITRPVTVQTHAVKTAAPVIKPLSVKNDTKQVIKQDDAIVVKDAGQGEVISIYTLSGKRVK